MVTQSLGAESIAKAKSRSPRKSMGARGYGVGRRRQGLGISNSRAFHDRINAVCRHILKCFDRAVRPTDFHGFHLFGRAEAEVETQIVLREIACAAADFAQLLYARAANGDARADCGAVAPRAHELEQGSML